MSSSRNGAANDGARPLAESDDAARDPWRRFPDAIAIAALLASSLLAIDGVRVRLPRAFDAGPHAWASAHFSVIARSFAEHGILARAGVPVQNNPPLGAVPDVYLHWPPLFTMLLSLPLRIYGATELVAHAVMAGFALLLMSVRPEASPPTPGDEAP